MTVSYEQLRQELEQQRETLRAELSESRVTPENGMGYGTHQADDASDAFEQAADLAVRQNAERLLYLVERALQRMEAGTYGLCRNCGNRIDDARLKVIPYTRHCMDCATRFAQREAP